MIEPQDLPLQDQDLSEAPHDLIADLAEGASRDLYTFSKGILGYPDISITCHQPLAVFLDSNPARFKLVLQPRGHFKTTLCTISRQLQKVTQNVENRLLLANETSTNAERFLAAIKSHAESNRRFRTLYSHIIPKDTRKVTWAKNEIVFLRQGSYPEPTIDTIGMIGAWTSRHYTHITFDDVISEEAAKSESVMKDVITRISKVFSLMTNTGEDTFDIIGTRWAFYDVYEYMMKWLGDRLARYIRGAIEDGAPIFPEMFSLESLALIRDAPDMGEYHFACQYLNNPRNPELQDFNTQDLKFWRWATDEEHVVLYSRDGKVDKVVEISKLDITVAVDLAPAEKITSDRNAVTVCGVTPSGDILVLDVWAERCTPLAVIEHLFNMQNRYTPRVIGIEGVHYQKAFKYFLAAECARRGVWMNIREVKAVGKKEVRIRGLQPIAATGHLFILPTQHLLRNEFGEFPLGEHDDTIDSLAMHQQLWGDIVSPERWARYKAAEKKLLQNISDYGLRQDNREEYDPDFDGEPEVESQDFVLEG